MFTGLFIINIDGVDGQWGEWQDMTHCSVGCGGGEKLRERFCNNPEPSNGGRPCSGARQKKVSCNSHSCYGKCITGCFNVIFYQMCLVEFNLSAQHIHTNIL